MNTELRNRTSGSTGVFDYLLSVLRALGEARSRTHLLRDERIEELLGCLEALPLTDDDLSHACRRFRNAQRFIRAHESGAAKWELAELLRQLDVSTARLLPEEITAHESLRIRVSECDS